VGRLKAAGGATVEANPCPCGSGRAYGDCCGPFLAGTAVPETAEQLMRSRYSAYVQGDADWLRATWHPATRRSRIDLDAQVRWIGLQILATRDGGRDDTKGTVEFVARYKSGGRAHRLHERSRFQRRNGVWFYVDGDLDPDPAVPPGPAVPDPGDDPIESSG
jgi:SEC-C motif-containing protein